MIEVRHLSFSYKADLDPVLKDITISFQPGESVAIIGANGSGKTSFIRCINGLHQPSEGTIYVDGLRVGDPDSIHEVRKRVGMVFQHPDDQIVSAQVEREIAFGLENIGAVAIHVANADDIAASFEGIAEFVCKFEAEGDGFFDKKSFYVF